MGARIAAETLISREADSTRPGAAASQSFCSEGAARAASEAIASAAKPPCRNAKLAAAAPMTATNSSQTLLRFCFSLAAAIEYSSVEYDNGIDPGYFDNRRNGGEGAHRDCECEQPQRKHRGHNDRQGALGGDEDNNNTQPRRNANPDECAKKSLTEYHPVNIEAGRA